MKSLGLLIPLLLLVGCSPYVDNSFYSPHPGLASIPATQPTQPPASTAYAFVVGIREPDDRIHLPLSVEMRFRLDNSGTDIITFDPRTLMLISGDLMRFGAPLLSSPPVQTINPGQSVMLTAEFPFPPGSSYEQFDLSTLQLQWTVVVGQKPIAQSIGFRRDVYPYYPGGGPYWVDPYYGQYPYFGPVVVIRHRW